MNTDGRTRVRTLTGKEIELDIEPDYKVSKIKERVEEKEGIPPVQQRLIFGGKQMYVFTLLSARSRLPQNTTVCVTVWFGSVLEVAEQSLAKRPGKKA